MGSTTAADTVAMKDELATAAVEAVADTATTRGTTEETTTWEAAKKVTLGASVVSMAPTVDLRRGSRNSCPRARSGRTSRPHIRSIRTSCPHIRSIRTSCPHILSLRRNCPY